MWPHFLLCPPGRRWIRHSQKDGGGRLITFCFPSIYWRPAWRRRPAKRSVCFQRKYFLCEKSPPHPSSPSSSVTSFPLPSPHLPSRAFWSQTFTKYYWTGALSDSAASHFESWQKAFERRATVSVWWRKAGVCVCVCLNVYVYCMFYWFFQGMWVFYIYFGVIVFFFLFLRIK